jgi:hypothetical protein
VEVYQKDTSRVKKIIRALKTKQLEGDSPHRLWEAEKIAKPAPLKTEGCGTLKAKTKPQVQPPAVCATR